MRKSILALAATLALAAAAPAHAALSVTGVCPAGGIATDCNFLIIFNADGSITTNNGPQTTYDGADDALIGVVNSTATPISGFTISGTNIFGFESDGINFFVPVTRNPGANALDQGGDPTYGGVDAYFTNISANKGSGRVNFFNPIAANGGRDYFSLEEAISLSAPPIIGGAVPEPATVALLGLGLIGLGFGRRRKG